MSAILFDHANLIRDSSGEVLRYIDWQARAGECWAIVGDTASGKTTLLEAIRGKHRVTVGRREVPERGVRFVAFQEDSRVFSYAGYYYQQRYEFADTDNPLSLTKFLTAGRSTTASQVEQVAERFGIIENLQQPFVTLSNGQTRRARLARAMLDTPDWLLLDDPFLGLDAAGRLELAKILLEVAATGPGLIFSTSPEWLPLGVANILELKAGHGMVRPRESFASTPDLVNARNATTADLTAPPVIEMNDVRVIHSGQLILDGITWTARRGERWAITGPNGAGKTTLLALACGDHPQAFCNDVRLFGARRGSGETIWDVKRKIGFVSPEFHLGFREPLTGLEAAATAFGDSLLYRPPTAEQLATLNQTFADFGCEELAAQHFRRMSVGQQRLVLLVRAVVKRPELLVLDEPFQGLDRLTAERVREWLERELQPTQTLLFVTHVPSQMPRTRMQRLELARGRITTSTDPALPEPSAPG